MIAAILALAPGALAHSVTRYSLSIREGETTQPEDSIVFTSGGVNSSATVAVSIIRGGTVIARDSGKGEGGAWLSQVPQPGDVVTLESPIEHVVGSIVYDGLPSIDSTVCAGSANFSGQRSSGMTVEGGYFSDVPRRYGGFETAGVGQAQVTLLAGSTFAGNFLRPLARGQTVFAIESLERELEGGAIFAYQSETDRPVAGCPVPPPPPLPPPPPPALFGSIFRLTHATLHSILRFGWRDLVTINMPGTVTQDLYLKRGKLPAVATSNSGQVKHPPPPVLLARGSATAKAAGIVAVVMKLTGQGRRRFRSSRSITAVLITTLRSTHGARFTLERRTVTLHR